MRGEDARNYGERKTKNGVNAGAIFKTVRETARLGVHGLEHTWARPNSLPEGFSARNEEENMLGGSVNGVKMETVEMSGTRLTTKVCYRLPVTYNTFIYQ